MSYPLIWRAKRSASNYEVLELLGEGNFSAVYKCEDKIDKKYYAMKIIDKPKVERMRKQKDVLMEKHAMQRLNHTNVCKLYHTWSDAGGVYLVSEYCDGGELWNYASKSGLPEDVAKYYFAQIINGVEYMHFAGIIHRDLKGENIMLTKEHRVKLIDLGTSKDLLNPHIEGAGNECMRTICKDYIGTPNFMAPEAIQNQFTDHRSDIFSLGCTFYQILFGLPPFAAGSEFLVFTRSMKGDLRFPPGTSLEAEDLIRRMVTPSADDRLGVKSFDEIREHAFFKDVNFKEAHNRSPPVQSLGALCLRSIGKTFNAEKPSFTKEWIKKQELTPHTKNMLKRILVLSEWDIRSRPGSGPGIAGLSEDGLTDVPLPADEPFSDSDAESP